MNSTPTRFLLLGIVSLLASSAAVLAQAPIKALSPVSRTRPLTEKEMLRWAHLDPIQDTVPGMSIDRAYAELIKKRKGQPILVAIIDSGIDLAHEDLKEVLWKNPKEIAGDGIDNDQNGYVDDVHGYNFLGESSEEQLEFVRILAKNLGDTILQKKAGALYETELAAAKASVPQFEQIEKFISAAHQSLQKKIGKETYTLKDLERYVPEGEEEERAIWMISQVMATGQDIPSALADLREGITYYQSRLDFNLNLEFDGRKPVGDNPYDLQDRN